jgi:hypothetical protein
MENLTINGIRYYRPGYCEAQGISKVFAAYAEHCSGEDIMYGGIGFNPNSGYVYIALENGVTICSMLGNDVEYIVTNFDNGEEYFFDTYHEASTFEVDLAN